MVSALVGATSVGILFLAIGALRALQTETGTRFQGHWSWAPYGITFVALDSGQARTLTGFEIGASVVDWAQGSTSVSDGGVSP